MRVMVYRERWRWLASIAALTLMSLPCLMAFAVSGPQSWADVAHDTSPGLRLAAPGDLDQKEEEPQEPAERIFYSPSAGTAIEQTTTQGSAPAPRLIASFNGLGASFVGPQGRVILDNPSDDSLAVGPNHIVQIVNTRMAVFTKQGEMFAETGRPVYGPVETRNVFHGFGGPCEEINNGDAVVRYDQLAERWLIVMPIFRRQTPRDPAPPAQQAGKPASYSMPGRLDQPGSARVLLQPASVSSDTLPVRAPRRPAPLAKVTVGEFAMCYAISTSADPLGSYYRYEFVRPLFPDYPRPAIWSDGYYVPSSTGDTVIQKHACVVERDKMLQGKPAREQCIIIDGVNFLNNADIDGRQLPPAGAPNIMIAAGGEMLHGVTHDDGIYVWKFHVDWDHPNRTRLEGPTKLSVAPYEYACGGQLVKCVPQPRSEMKIDVQGDKIVPRLVYRRIGQQESLLVLHSVATQVGSGVRWYELRLGNDRSPTLYQQGTYAPDGNYRWLPSGAIDRYGNIGIGYSFGGREDYPGQRFAGRLASDPPGKLSKEVVLVAGEAAQHDTLRWEDYTQTAVDPDDDCTIWYVGDYLRDGDANYSSKIGAFRLGQCDQNRPPTAGP